MTTRRILVLYSRSLYAQGIEGLLKRLEGLEVIGIDLDQPEAIERVADLQPDAVIIDTSDLSTYGGTLILQLLRDNPAVQVLCLSVLDGGVDIYRRQHLIASRPEELIEALQRG